MKMNYKYNYVFNYNNHIQSIMTNYAKVWECHLIFALKKCVKIKIMFTLFFYPPPTVIENTLSKTKHRTEFSCE